MPSPAVAHDQHPLRGGRGRGRTHIQRAQASAQPREGTPAGERERQRLLAELRELDAQVNVLREQREACKGRLGAITRTQRAQVREIDAQIVALWKQRTPLVDRLTELGQTWFPLV